jgi:membrane-bound lytic murein transglycosylase B
MMFSVHVRRVVCLTVATACLGALVACGADSHPGPSSASTLAPRVPPTGTSAPETAKVLAPQLAAVDAALRGAIRDWRGGVKPGSPPPDAVAVRAGYVQRVVRLLARRPRLEAATVRRLSPRLGRETRELTAARRELARLSAGWPAHRVAAGPPKPLDELLRYYRVAQSRFGIRWQVLAAVNLVESAFGRVRSGSVAGAQGPMQFMPATWRVYGLDGNIDDPHDAVLGAANLLRHAGAPGDYSRALYAYNPSRAYVDAVQSYARLMARDRDAVYLLYSWKP